MINKLLECFKKNKNNISVFLEIVKYYRFNNKLLEAEQFIKENNQFKNNSDVKFELANIYSCENRKEESITIFEELTNSVILFNILFLNSFFGVEISNIFTIHFLLSSSIS